MNYEEFTEIVSVSRETYLRLSRYVELLQEWGAAINLVSRKDELWQRHIIDSAQLAKAIEKDNHLKIVDMGSGGGLPGIVLAIMIPNLITLIESDRRKSLFLKNCVRELELKNATIINERIEKVDIRADIVTARALASLDKLLNYSSGILIQNGRCLFSKGQSYEKEIAEAQGDWEFNSEITPSLSGNGVLIMVERIKEK